MAIMTFPKMICSTHFTESELEEYFMIEIFFLIYVFRFALSWAAKVWMDEDGTKYFTRFIIGNMKYY